VQLLFSTCSFVPLSSLERRAMVGASGTGKDGVVALPEPEPEPDQPAVLLRKKGHGRAHGGGRPGRATVRIERSLPVLTPHD
jgi:hypothetical protein